MGQHSTESSALCFLDLSAALDTTHHSILLHQISWWFGISGTAVYCIEWHSLKVKINNSISPLFPVLNGVPQGSVFAPLLFVLYTTPLSSDSSSSYHLYYYYYCRTWSTNITYRINDISKYAVDTQLYFVSTACFDANVCYFVATISEVSPWLTISLHSLNPYLQSTQG